MSQDLLAFSLSVEFGNGIHGIRTLDRLIVFEFVAEAIQKLS